LLTPALFLRLANKHFLKVADLSALESDYYKSIEHYERIGRASINNNLLKWSVKDYFLKAGICHLATNVRSFVLHHPI
jgi:alpha-soluble NSF attachment protein